MVLLSMFLLSVRFSSLYFSTSMYSGTVQTASVWALTTYRDMSSRGGDSVFTTFAKMLQYGPDRLWDVWVHMIVYRDRPFGCWLIFCIFVMVNAVKGISI